MVYQQDWQQSAALQQPLWHRSEPQPGYCRELAAVK